MPTDTFFRRTDHSTTKFFVFQAETFDDGSPVLKQNLFGLQCYIVKPGSLAIYNTNNTQAKIAKSRDPTLREFHIRDCQPIESDQYVLEAYNKIAVI